MVKKCYSKLRKHEITGKCKTEIVEVFKFTLHILQQYSWTDLDLDLWFIIHKTNVSQGNLLKQPSLVIWKLAG